MTNIHLERDTKEPRFLNMKWERHEASNTIIAVDNSVHHNYHYRTRKALNKDWHDLNNRKQYNVLKEQIIAEANKLIDIANSDAHLTDKGCILHFIANELKAIGTTAINEHKKQIDSKDYVTLIKG